MWYNVATIKTYPTDPTVLGQVKPYKEKIENLQQEIVGTTNVLLEANRKKETNLGNLVTDSMVHWVNILEISFTLVKDTEIISFLLC